MHTCWCGASGMHHAPPVTVKQNLYSWFLNKTCLQVVNFAPCFITAISLVLPMIFAENQILTSLDGDPDVVDSCHLFLCTLDSKQRGGPLQKLWGLVFSANESRHVHRKTNSHFQSACCSRHLHTRQLLHGRTHQNKGSCGQMERPLGSTANSVFSYFRDRKRIQCRSSAKSPGSVSLNQLSV